MAKVNNTGLVDINDFLNKYKQKGQESVLNGEYYQFEGDNRFSNTNFLDSRTKQEKQSFVEYTKRAKEKELTIAHLFDTLDNKARANGLQLYFRESGRKDNTWDVYYIPTEDYQKKILKQTQQQVEDYLKTAAKFNFSEVDVNNGLININGQQVINQLLKDRVDKETVLITMLEKQLLEQNRLFDLKKNGTKTAFLQNLEKLQNTQDEKEREKLIKKSKNSVNYVDKTVKEGGVASSNFRGLVDEYMKARQGVGSSKSLAIRQGYVNQKPWINRIIEENYASIAKYQRQFNGSREVTYDKAKEGIAQHIMQIFAMYAQATEAENIEKEINSLQEFNYLKNTNLLKEIQKEGREINKTHPYIGSSQEGSIGNFLLSYYRANDIDFMGGLDDKSSRKRVQVTNVFERREQAKKLAKQLTKKRKVFTKADVIKGFTGDDEEMNLMYNEGFLTQDEIAKAAESLGKTDFLKNFNKSAREGGIFIAKSVASSLDSEQKRTTTVDTEKFLEKYKWVKEKYAGLTQQEAEQTAALLLLEEMKGVEINRNDNGKYGAAGLLKKFTGKNGKKLFVDISDDLDYNGKKQKVLSFAEERSVRSGQKILGSDYNIKGSAQIIDDDIIKKALELRGWSNDDITKFGFKIIRNPENLSIRNLSGVLSSYVENVFEAIASKGNNNATIVNNLNKFGTLKNWLKDDNGVLSVNKDIFDKVENNKLSEKTLIKFIDEFNTFRKGFFTSDVDRDSIYLKDAFTTTKDGGIHFNSSNYIGSTSAGIAAQSEYGEPGPDQKNLNVDYRYKGAVDRAIKAAALSSGKNLSLLHKYLLGDNQQTINKQGEHTYAPNIDKIPSAETGKEFDYKFRQGGLYSGSKEDKQNYVNWLQQVEEVNKVVNNSILKDGENIDPLDQLARLAEEGRTIVGYGDLNSFLENYQKTVVENKLRLTKQEEDRQKIKSKWESFVKYLKENEKDNYFDLSQEFSDWQYDEGLVTKESFQDSLIGKLFETQQKSKKNNKGNLVYIPTIGGFVSKSGNKAAVGNIVELADLGVLNPTLTEEGREAYPVSDVYKGLYRVRRAEEEGTALREQRVEHDPDLQSEYTNKQKLSDAIIDFYAIMKDTVMNKEGSLWQKANKVAIGHSMFGAAVSGPVLAPDLFDENNEAYLRDINETGVAISKGDLRKLLLKDVDSNKEDYFKSLVASYHYLWDDAYDKGFEEVESKLEEELKNTKDTSKKIQKLINDIVDSITMGTGAFNARLEKVKARGGIFRGLSSNFVRFPLSNGFDVQGAELFADTSLANGSMRAGLGLGKGVNLDFDGDKINVSLNLTNGELMKEIFGTEDSQQKDSMRELLEEFKTNNDMFRRINSAIGYVETRSVLNLNTKDEDERKGKLYTVDEGNGEISLQADISKEELQGLFNEGAQQTSAILSRINKKYTGMNSNNYQAVAEALSAVTPHGNDVNELSDDAKQKFVRDMITRGLFEALTQDAISSKKVVNRITKESLKSGKYDGGDWTENAQFYTELQELMDSFKQADTYSSSERFNRVLQKGINMGIFDDKDMFADRITTRILATAQDLYTDKKTGEVNLSGYAKALGLSEEEAKNRLFKYNSKHQVIGYQNSDKEGEQSLDRGLGREIVTEKILSANEDIKQNIDRGGIAGVQIRKGSYIPGNISTSSAPVYRLGGVSLSQSEINHLKLLNPALGDLASSYDDLKESAEATTKALNKEAEAEENKIKIANVESKAISEGSRAYAERETILAKLAGRHKEGSESYIISESSALNRIFGNNYENSEPFRESLIAAYKKEQENIGGELPDNFIISPENLGWTLGGETTEQQKSRFEKDKKGLIRPLAGTISDSLEQVLSEVNVGLTEIEGELAERIDTYEKLKNFLDKQFSGKNSKKYKALQKAIRLALVSGTKGAEGVDFLLGRANYQGLNIDDILPNNDKNEWTIRGKAYKNKKEAFTALQQSNSDNDILFKALFGDQKERYKRLYADLGGMAFQATLGAANNNINNIGPKEFEIAYNKKGDNTITQGRLDTIIYDTLKANTKNIFGDNYNEDKGVINVFDKKLTDNEDAAPRYIAQVLDYIDALKQLQDTLKKVHGNFRNLNEEQLNQEIEEFKDIELGHEYSATYGEGYLDSPQFKEMYRRLRRGDIIKGGLLLTNSFGQNTQLDFGYSGKDGKFHLTGDNQIDNNILNYLRNNTLFEEWDETTKKRYSEIAKRNTGVGANQGKKLAFTKGEEAWGTISDEKDFDAHVKNIKQLKKVNREIKSLEGKENAGKSTSAQRERLENLRDIQVDLKDKVDKKTKQYNDAEKNLESEQIASSNYKELQAKRNKILESLQKDDTNFEINFQDIKDVNEEYKEVQKLVEKLIFQGMGETGDYNSINPALRENIDKLKEELEGLYKKLKEFTELSSNKLTTTGKAQAAEFLKVTPNDIINQAIDKGNSKYAEEAIKIKKGLGEESANFVNLEKQRKILQETLDKYGDTFTAEEKSDIKTQIDNIDREIFTHVVTKIQEYENFLEKLDSKEVEKWKNYRNKNLEKNNKEVPSIVKNNALQTQNATKQDYLEKYRRFYNRQNDIEEAKKLLSNSKDVNERYILALELEQKKELYQQEVEQIKEHKQTISSGENAKYLQGLDSEAEKRALAEYSLNRTRKEGSREKYEGITGNIANSVGGSVKNLSSGFGSYQIINRLMQSLSKLITEAKALDKTLTNLRIVTSDTKENTRGLVSRYSELANALGATTQEVANSAVEWLRQGYSVSESMDLVKSSMYLSTLGMIDSASATQSLTSALKGFKLQATESMEVVDKLTALDLEAATSAGDIAQGLSQFANLGSLAGVNIDEAAAYVATISDVTQMTGASAGQALKTIISRYGNVKAGSYNKLNVSSDGTDDSTAVNDVENVLKNLGISIRSSTLQFRDFDEVLSEIAEKWNSLDTVSQKAVATSFAGVRQQEAFVTLMQNWDKYEELLETSQNSSGTAEKKYQTYQESLTASLNKLTSTWENFANNYEISEVLRHIYDALTGIMNSLPTIVRWLPQIVTGIDSFRSVSGNSIWQKILRGLGDNVGNNKSLTSIFNKHYAGEDKIKRGFRIAKEVVLGENAYPDNPKKYKYFTIDNGENLITDVKENGLITTENVNNADSKKDYFVKKENVLSTDQYEDLTGAYAWVPIANDYVPSEDVNEKNKKGQIKEDKDKNQNISTSKATDEIIEIEKEITKEKEKQLEITRKESEAKKEVVDSAKQEVTEKKETTIEGETEVNNKGKVAQNSKIEADNSEKTVIDSKIEAQNEEKKKTDSTIGANEEKKGLISNKGKTEEEKKQYLLEQGQTKTKTKMGVSGVLQALGGSQIGVSAAGTALGIGGMAVSFLANEALAAYSAYQTSGNSHTRIGANGEEESVSSSEKAKKAGKETAARWALVPVIGSVIGEKMSNAIMQQIDAEKDFAEVTTEKAEDIIKTLNSVESNITSIVSTIDSISSDDLQEREKTVKSIIEELYTTDGRETRTLLEEQLREFYGDSSVTLYSVLKDILSENSDVSKKATRSLDVAQSILEMNQKQLANSTDNYNEEEDLKEDIYNYVVASTFNGTTTFFEPEALRGVTGSTELERQAEYFANSPEKLKQYLEERKKFYLNTLAQEELSDSDKTNIEQQLEDISELLSSVDGYLSYIESSVATYNENYTNAQLKQAKTKDGRYLVNLNISEAKALGATNLYNLLAEAVGAHGLKGINTYNYLDKNGNMITGKTDEELEKMVEEGTAIREYSEQFKEYAKKAFKTDDEIWSAISGSSYTLRGALTKLNPNDKEDREILKNFANVFGTTVEGLYQYVDKFGELKYSELIKSTNDLIEEQEGYLDLMDNISDSTKSATEWMNNIINNYPDLIAYMSDTPALMEQIMKKIKQLGEYEIATQWKSIANSDSAFHSDDPTVQTLEKDMLDSAGENKDKLKALIDTSGASTLNGLIKYWKGLDENSEEYKILENAISKAGSSYTLTSDAYKSALENYINYNSTLLENQINNLTAQKEALQDINSQREYENKLIEAKLALEDAVNNKKRVYRTGVGFVYETDQKAISEAEDNLKEVQIEKDVSAIQKQIDTLQKQKDDWDNIRDRKNYELQEEQAIAFANEFLNQNNIISSSFNSLNLEEKLKAGLIPGIKEVVENESGEITGLLDEEGRTYNIIKDSNGNIVGAITEEEQGIIKYLGTEGVLYSVATNGNQNLLDALKNGNISISGLISSGQGNIVKALTEKGDGISSILTEKGNSISSTLSNLYNGVDGFKTTFTTETQRIIDAIKGGEEDSSGDKGTKKASLEEAQAAWENFKSVSALKDKTTGQLVNPKGSANYNEALLKYQNAYNAAFNEGYITETSDGNDETKNDWTRGGDDFGSKMSRDYATEDITNTGESDSSNEDDSNPFYNKVILTRDLPYNRTTALTSPTMGPTLINDDAKNDASNKRVWRLADLSGKGVSTGEISQEARSWALRTKNWSDLSKIPDGIYKSGQDFAFQQQTYLVYKGNFYPLNNQYTAKSYAFGVEYNMGDDPNSWYEVTEADWGKYTIWGGQITNTKHKKGTYSTPVEEHALINEIGTEAIVTPSGTLTALPSHTGIVPADITKNLWSLGEVAPSILRVIDNINPNATGKFISNTNSGVDESVNISGMNITINATEEFGIDDFIDELKACVQRTKNIRR